jgi:hypothetical protein
MENVSQESVVVAKIADFGLFWAPIYVENRGTLTRART